jgi:hypothetical protein
MSEKRRGKSFFTIKKYHKRFGEYKRRGIKMRGRQTKGRREKFAVLPVYKEMREDKMLLSSLSIFHIRRM